MVLLGLKNRSRCAVVGWFRPRVVSCNSPETFRSRVSWFSTHHEWSEPIPPLAEWSIFILPRPFSQFSVVLLQYSVVLLHFDLDLDLFRPFYCFYCIPCQFRVRILKRKLNPNLPFPTYHSQLTTPSSPRDQRGPIGMQGYSLKPWWVESDLTLKFWWVQSHLPPRSVVEFPVTTAFSSINMFEQQSLWFNGGKFWGQKSKCKTLDIHTKALLW